MKKTEQVINRCNLIIDKAIEEMRNVYTEANDNYRDTGFERYYRKMNAIEEEIDILDGYRNAKLYMQQTDRENQKLKRTIMIYLKKLDELIAEYPGDDNVSQIISWCKSKMDSAKMEAGVLR